MLSGLHPILLLSLAATVGARRCFPDEKMSEMVETNCPPDWYCYKFENLMNKTMTMGCTQYPWRIPMGVRKEFFQNEKREGCSGSHSSCGPKTHAILAPDKTVLDRKDKYTYCATREVYCDWTASTLYEFEPEDILAYLDWFEGAKYYMHYHSDRITEIVDIAGEPIPWYYFNVLFGFDYITPFTKL